MLGAIVLCKTTMDEFAMGSASDTCNLGNVINPWTKIFLIHLPQVVPQVDQQELWLLQAHVFLWGLIQADQLGNQPLLWCSRIKPTYGRCSRFGIIAFASSLDQAGPFTKNVEDGALALTHMVSYDNKDSTSSKEKMPDLFKNLKSGIKGFKIGIPKQYNIRWYPGRNK